MGLTATKAVVAEQGYSLSHGTITFDSSYPTGGEALAASLVGLDFVSKIFLQPRGSAALAYQVTYDLSGKKLLVRPIRPVLRRGVVNGAAAGNVTCTGVVAATDTLFRVVADCRTATPAYARKDLTSEFAVCADNTIGNAAGTASVNGTLEIEYLRSTDQEVTNTTDLSALVVDFVAYQFNDQIA
jgi:hypothetical protein